MEALHPPDLTASKAGSATPTKVKIIESKVHDYEERVQVIAKALAKQETARALDQKHRLEEKINELNSQTKNLKK